MHAADFGVEGRALLILSLFGLARPSKKSIPCYGENLQTAVGEGRIPLFTEGIARQIS